MFHFLLFMIACLFAYLTWRDLRLGLFLIAATLPAYLIRFSFFGLPSTLLELLIIILTAIWLIKHNLVRPDQIVSSKSSKRLNFFRILDYKMVRPDHFVIGSAIVLLLLASTIGIFISPDKIAALGIWKAYFIEPLIVFAIALDMLKDKKDQKKLVFYLGLGALFVALFAIFQKFTLWAIPAPWDIHGRVTGIFPYPNAVGLYLGPIIVLGFFQFISSLNKNFSNLRQTISNPTTLLWLITLPAATLAVIFAQTEAAYFAIPAAIAFGLIAFTKYRRPTLIISFIIIALLAIIPTSRQTIWQKISFQDYSGTVRLAQWDETWHLLQNNLIFGVGLSGYPQALKPYHTHPNIEIFQYPHNFVFNIWTELGILGLIASFLLAYQIVKNSSLLNLTPSQKGAWQNHWITPAATAALLEMTIHGLVDVPYFKNDLAILTWLLIALILLSAKDKQTSIKQPASKTHDREL